MRRRIPLLPQLPEGTPLAPLLVLFGLNAVDELDRTGFAVLTPEIRDHFGLDNEGILTVIAAVAAVAFGLQPFIGYYADRLPRVRLAVLGASAWALFSVSTGLAPIVLLLVLARIGSGLGRIVNDPTHNSLLADYYPPETRVRVYGIHRIANPFGQAVGPLMAGFLAFYLGWRAPFFFFAVPTAVMIVLAVIYLREPVRGGHERRAHGASDETVATEEAPPSFAESWRICSQVRTLRRIWAALPFLAASLIGINSLTNIFYEDVFNLNEAERGIIGAANEPFQAVGILVGVPIASRLFLRDEGLVLKMLAVSGAITAAFIVGLALAPNLGFAVVMHILLASALGIVAPGIYATLSLVIPPRARALGFAIGSLYVLPGVFVLIIIGGVADDSGIRAGLLVLVPVFVIGALILASAGSFVRSDISKVRASTVAQSDVLAARRRGEAKLLLVKDLDVAYDNVQVLFGVNFEIDEGEIVALLGTNGAGKSTLLRAISGLVSAQAGAVVFDGADMTYAPPQEVAARGVVQVPGGKGVFPGLTVAENLRIAGWLYQKDKAYLDAAIAQVLTFFPVLHDRWDQPAGNLSGGEQQMLTLAQAFIAKPRLLMIDELSLGLAPVIVDRLLGIVGAIRERGTTIILVEQSVNVALTAAETAYFMEKGEIRFHGPTEELLERPDVLRSVFLEGAGAATQNKTRPGGPDGDGERVVTVRSQAGPDRDGPPVLEVRGVNHSFGGIRALDEVSFVLHPGEILGVIGPNGAGKTTLFDVISGFITADAGRIMLAGRDITELSPDGRARLGLGRSFQDARLFPALTVAETIALALERDVETRDPLAAALHLPAVLDAEHRITARVDELIDLMGLGAFADKFVSELSTGSRRIVDLACVLAHRPEVLLFDEPSSGIAQRETEQLGPMLRRVRESTGASLLVIEHDMPLVTSISDRMLALDLGHVIVEGSPHEVVNDPTVVISYLGTTEEVIARSGAVAGGPTRR